MAHGKSLHMANIRVPGPKPVFVHVWRTPDGNPIHDALTMPPTRQWRRHPVPGRKRFMPRDLQTEAHFGQHINPARDLRKGRRLRAELRSGV